MMKRSMDKTQGLFSGFNEDLKRWWKKEDLEY